ncbi:hypothetical protein BWI15_35200 [Kribbella sp. ALI-6-A]|nr:hypothetical protein BWI15_35200 [Kribbella sp. ALI-6-A]
MLATRYEGSVAQLLHGHGYDADHSVTNDAVRSGGWERCPGGGCNYAGTSASVRNHRAKAAH